MAQVTLGALAVRFGLALRGDPDRLVRSVGTLEGAGDQQLAFLADPKLVDRLAGCRAGAVVLHPASQASCPVDCLIADHPHAAFARIAAVLHPPPVAPPGVHPSAVVAADAEIHPEAHIGPLSVVGSRARIGARSVIGPGSMVGEGADLAEDVRLVARVTVLERVVIGARSVPPRVALPHRPLRVAVAGCGVVGGGTLARLLEDPRIDVVGVRLDVPEALIELAGARRPGFDGRRDPA